MIKTAFGLLLKLLLIILLTVTTQVGGIILIITWLCLLILPKERRKSKMQFALFIMLYLSFSAFIIPDLAERFGRVPLPLSHPFVKPANMAYCLLNRHYVRPPLKKALFDISSQFGKQFPQSEVRYLDAGFPFLNKFPLLPHLSHHDGKKLDLAFIYQKDGKPSNSSPSVSGYGVFDEPKAGESNTNKICQTQGYWQYDHSKYFTFGSWGNYEVDEAKTKALVRQFAQHPAIGKVFIEPHLKQRWGLNYNKIRFHGCQAVRHDDHIHVQLR